jgi:hypothetical protein
MADPDWEALADVQFALYNRVANQLNEALSGIALSDMPEAGDKPPGYWKERATTKILNVLNLFTAWTWLLRFKMGEPIPERAIRPFRTNALLGWVGTQLQLSPPPVTTLNPLLRANQETLQEALLLLYSVAYTQGSAVRLAFEATTLGTWFRIRFDRHKDLPESIDALLTSFGSHWRAQDAVFELTNARDFVRLNGCELVLNVTPQHGEFAFFVPAAASRPQTGRLSAVQAAAQPTRPSTQTAPLSSQVVTPKTPKPAVEEGISSSDDTPVLEGPEPIPPPASKPAVEEGVSSPDDTPVMRGPGPVPPPTLAELRPRPRQAVPPPSPVPPPATAGPEGQAPQGEPDGEMLKAGESTGADTVQRSSSERPPAAPEPKAPFGSVIVRAKIPEPKLPEHLHTPPASTSNVALTKETQTLTPVRKQDATAAGDSDEAVSPPHQVTPDSARKEDRP